MKTFNVFKSEIEVAHKATFEVPQVLDVKAADVTKFGGKIPAGVFIASAGAGHIIANPTDKALVAATGKANGVLAHDVAIDGIGSYACGVIVTGVVYEDVVKAAIGGDIDDADRTALAAQGCLIYNQKTI